MQSFIAKCLTNTNFSFFVLQKVGVPYCIINKNHFMTMTGPQVQPVLSSTPRLPPVMNWRILMEKKFNASVIVSSPDCLIVQPQIILCRITAVLHSFYDSKYLDILNASSSHSPSNSSQSRTSASAISLPFNLDAARVRSSSRVTLARPPTLSSLRISDRSLISIYTSTCL